MNNFRGLKGRRKQNTTQLAQAMHSLMGAMADEGVELERCVERMALDIKFADQQDEAKIKQLVNNILARDATERAEREQRQGQQWGQREQ
jgi:hypothetical protein